MRQEYFRPRPHRYVMPLRCI